MRTHLEVLEDHGPHRCRRTLYQCPTCERYGFQDEFREYADDCLECEAEKAREEKAGAK